MGYGVFVPVFFVATGVCFDLDALFASATNLTRVPIFLAALLIARGLPALVYKPLTTRTQTIAAGLLQATSLELLDRRRPGRRPARPPPPRRLRGARRSWTPLRTALPSLTALTLLGTVPVEQGPRDPGGGADQGLQRRDLPSAGRACRHDETNVGAMQKGEAEFTQKLKLQVNGLTLDVSASLLQRRGSSVRGSPLMKKVERFGSVPSLVPAYAARARASARTSTGATGLPARDAVYLRGRLCRRSHVPFKPGEQP